MADVFEKNPISYIDINTLFPILNSKVGFAYPQLKAIVENINFVKNNLGVSDLLIGEIETETGEVANVEITTRKATIDEKPVLFLDFIITLPESGVKSVNGKTGAVELNAEDVGAVAEKSSVPLSQGGETQGILKNEINQFTYTTQDIDNDGNASNIKSMSINPSGMVFDGLERPLINGENQMAYLSDIENAIGGVSELLGNTEDLEV